MTNSKCIWQLNRAKVGYRLGKIVSKLTFENYKKQFMIKVVSLLLSLLSKMYDLTAKLRSNVKY